MPGLDAPHWSWLHGCRKHRGEIPPCKVCIAARDPDITRDGAKAFGPTAAPGTPHDPPEWEAFYRALA